MLRQLPIQRIWYQARKTETMPGLVLWQSRHLTFKILTTLGERILQHNDRVRIPQ